MVDLRLTLRMKSLSALLFLTSLSATLADNHTTDTTNSTSDGLGGGAIAGIIIGVLAGLTAVGVGVWYFFMRPMAGAKAMTSAATASSFGDNNLPMVALRVPGDDDL